MTNFIEELYYGNIDPQAREYNKGNKIVKISDKINEIEKDLNSRLNGKEKELFFDLCNVYADMLKTSDLDSFICGFRFGARFMYDTFFSNNSPLESYLKD